MRTTLNARIAEPGTICRHRGAPGRFLRGRTLRDAMAVEHSINQDRPGYGFGRLLTYRQAVSTKAREVSDASIVHL
jgi:hypothetical protein